MSFLEIPIEILQMIAGSACDRDLAALSATCRGFREALCDPGFWHLRFLRDFDDALVPSNHWQRALQSRKGLLSRGQPTSGPVMAVVRALIIEARKRNFDVLKNWIDRSGVLRTLFWVHAPLSKTSKPVATVLACLAAYMFDPTTKLHAPIYGFPECQRMAYSSVAEAPIMTGSAHHLVNTQWVLATLQFFRSSLLSHEVMRAHYEQLLCSERPQLWTSLEPLTLGKVWRGTYSYLERDKLQLLRANHCERFEDRNFDNDNPIQTMKLFKSQGVQFDALNSLGPYKPAPQAATVSPAIHKPKPQAKTSISQAISKASFPFEGLGWDEENFFTSGWINPLPPQNGIPGFARITMMKYFIENGQIDYSALWAYEGVILPGGQLMVGRWWSPDHGDPAQQYSGPFLMWNVEGAWDPAEAEYVADHDGLQPGFHGLMNQS